MSSFSVVSKNNHNYFKRLLKYLHLFHLYTYISLDFFHIFQSKYYITTNECRYELSSFKLDIKEFVKCERMPLFYFKMLFSENTLFMFIVSFKSTDNFFYFSILFSNTVKSNTYNAHKQMLFRFLNNNKRVNGPWD